MPVVIHADCDYCWRRGVVMYVPQPGGLPEYRCQECIGKPSKLAAKRRLFGFVVIAAGVAFWSWVTFWILSKIFN